LQPDEYDPNANLPAFVNIGNAIDVAFGDLDSFQKNFTADALQVTVMYQ
jgi:superoxide dismutase